MQKLDKRVEALEKTQPPVENLTIIRRFVSPGFLNEEIRCLSDDFGNRWDRQPGETEQELIDRASSEVRHNAWGVGQLSTKDEVQHAAN
jgi:hypothetical protein